MPVEATICTSVSCDTRCMNRTSRPPNITVASQIVRTPRSAAARTASSASAKRANERSKRLTVAKVARALLPGDSQFGDPLSTGGKEQPQLVGRRLAELTAERPGFLREAGLSALQVWQSVAEAQGRGRGDRDIAIVFTDLVDFSDWALEAGD